MPRSAIVNVPIRSWTELTAGDVAAIAVQCQSAYPVLLTATTGAAPAGVPDDTIATYVISPGQLLPASVWLADLWPGVSGAKRVWAWSEGAGAACAVSHA
ncbi:hypothetical protein [Tabrizicola fusiformis]|uniref:hypothetical protein n=1 Tax=Tabrizicola sp. SY72 TaxID=2741673 RepID=UPI0015740B08|nr:hypothetical protein [Tabrizicola sp. SY72]NTT88393.1 hypothetical protein [Tabrizicola sp. SY72]